MNAQHVSRATRSLLFDILRTSMAAASAAFLILWLLPTLAKAAA